MGKVRVQVSGMEGEVLDLHSAAAACAPHFLCIREASSLAVSLRIKISPWRFSLLCALHLGVQVEVDRRLIRTGAASDSNLVLWLHSSAPLGRLEGAVHSFQLIRCTLVWGPIHRPTLLCGTQSSPNARIAAVTGYFQHCSVRTENPGKEATQKALESNKNAHGIIHVWGGDGETFAQGLSRTEPRDTRDLVS